MNVNTDSPEFMAAWDTIGVNNPDFYNGRTTPNDVAAAIQAYNAAKPSQWRVVADDPPPIDVWVLLAGGITEEAPYDETLCKDYGAKTPEQQMEWRRRPVTAMASYGVWGDDDELFYVYDFWDGAWRSGYTNPTHWQPLPPSPKEGA